MIFMNSLNLTMVIFITILEFVFISSIFFINSPFSQQAFGQGISVTISGAIDGNGVLLTDEKGRTNSTYISIGFHATSLVKGVSIKNYLCSFDGMPFVDCQSVEYNAECTENLSDCTISKDFKSAGPHFFNVKAIDTRGGHSSTHATWWITKGK
jgi:hypothetical protein